MIDVTLSVAVPELVSCILVVADVSPKFMSPKATAVGDSVKAGPRPVPDRMTTCGLPDALSTTLTVAVLAPAVVGANCTPRKQELPALRLLTVKEHCGEPLVDGTNAN